MNAARKKEEQQELDQALANDFAIAVSTILNNSMHHYWLSSTDEKAAMDEAYRQLKRCFEEVSDVNVSVFENLLRVNGIIVDNNNPNVHVYVEHLNDLGVNNFSILKGISEEDFFKVIEIIDAQPFELEQLGGFEKLLQDFNVKNVEVRKITYKQVAEDETIIATEEADKIDKDEGLDKTQAANILAFLKGDVAAGDQEAVKDVQEIASNADKMAELIMQAAEIRQQSAPLEEGESLVDFVVGCMKKTYHSLTQQKAYKTKIGKKRVTKNLLLLEEEILNRMREMSMEWTDADFDAIADATQEMTDEMHIDELLDDYTNKQKANEESERKLLEYLRAHGITDPDDPRLKDKLADKGLSMDGWQELVIKNEGPGSGGPGPGPGGEGSGGDGAGTGQDGGPGNLFGLGNVLDAISHLDVLLTQMDKQLDEGDKAVEIEPHIMESFDQAHSQVKDVTANTEAAINSLITGMADDEDAIQTLEARMQEEGQKLKLTRKNMRQMLADIVTNITEPLALINICIDSILSKKMGNLSDAQIKVLKVAKENTVTIKGLLDKLNTGMTARNREPEEDRK